MVIARVFHGVWSAVSDSGSRRAVRGAGNGRACCDGLVRAEVYRLRSMVIKKIRGSNPGPTVDQAPLIRTHIASNVRTDPAWDVGNQIEPWLCDVGV